MSLILRLRTLIPLISLLPALLAATTGVAVADPGPAGGGPIMPLSQVQPGMSCTADTVIQGTAISTFDVQVIAVVQQNGEGPRILVSVSGPAVAQTGIAEGFSGSPVYCPDATGTPENIGAISEGVGQYGNNVGLVTPIEQMLGEPINPPSALPKFAAQTRQLVGPLTVSGLSPAVLAVLEQAGRRTGRLVVAAPSTPFLGFPVQPLVPGASVAASYSTGAIAIGAIGTVTYAAGQAVYAFGHPLDGAGRRSLLLQDAYVYTVIGNPDPGLAPSYKFASPGHVEGTLTADTPNAIIGTLGAPPQLIGVNVTATDLDTGQVLQLDTQTADETDIGFPTGTSLIDLVAPLALAQTATQIYDGPPANESGRMCLTVTLRESHAPLSFCNRYAGTGASGSSQGPPDLATATSSDLSSALGLLDGVQFAQLHVVSMSAHIYAQRGLVEGQLLTAQAPSHVKPRQLITIHAHVRLYRGPLRTFSFKLRIPGGLHGFVVAHLKGTDAASLSGAGGSLASQLAGALSGSSSPSSSSSGPASIADLRHQFAAIGRYDGLELSFPRMAPIRVYRNATLPILGSTAVTFTVGR
ncbi:MAG: hypothetical protein ACYDHH_20775 [Solirubrobacteraceae bacterium]